MRTWHFTRVGSIAVGARGKEVWGQCTGAQDKEGRIDALHVRVHNAGRSDPARVDRQYNPDEPGSVIYTVIWGQPQSTVPGAGAGAFCGRLLRIQQYKAPKPPAMCCRSHRSSSRKGAEACRRWKIQWVTAKNAWAAITINGSRHMGRS